MTKVEIELDTLRLWFRKLDMNETEDVTELIYDKIQELEAQIKSDEYKQAKKKEAVLATIEPSLQMNQLIVDAHYRIKKQPNFKQSFMVLAGAEVKVIKKARTKVTVLIIEPGNQFTGQSLKTDVTSLTNL